MKRRRKCPEGAAWDETEKQIREQANLIEYNSL